MHNWRYVYASVPGVAHRAQSLECQDACAVAWLDATDGSPVLVLVAADGAGSAAHARTGAELACQALLTECALELQQTRLVDWQRDQMEQLIERVQAVLNQRAADQGQTPRDYACTLLAAILGEDRALFSQIGDGAIVIGDEAGYWPVFWPQSGQYANETYFLTDSNAFARLEFATTVEPVAEIALLTDGLQTLALHYQTRQAHVPFFRPLFQQLRATPTPGCTPELLNALERFLDTPTLNQRTHDDKTLILATRLSRQTAASDPPAPPAASSASDACLPADAVGQDVAHNDATE